MIRAAAIVLLLLATSAQARPYTKCGAVDPYCELLPRQGEPLQPSPSERRMELEYQREAARQYPRRQMPPPVRQPTQQQWKNAIIEEANKYCSTFPNDEICHFKEPLP